MGKYCTYRRRGRATATAPLLGPPLAPILSVVFSQLSQGSIGLDDPGGTVQLWHSSDGQLTWQLYDIHAWENPHSWGSTDDLPADYFRGCEVGNGTIYVGQSPWSNIIDNT